MRKIGFLLMIVGISVLLASCYSRSCELPPAEMPMKGEYVKGAG